MMPRMRGWPLLLALACAPGPVRIDVGGLEGAVVLVGLDASGRVVQIDPPVFLQGGQRRWGDRPMRSLEPTEATLFVVAMKTEALLGHVPGCTPERPNSLRLLPGPPDPQNNAPVITADGLQQVRAELPPGTQTFRVSETGALLPEVLPVTLGLEVLRNPEYCGSGRRKLLEPYARPARPFDVGLDPGPDAQHWGPRLAWVDSSRTLLVYRYLLLLERGTDFVANRGATFLEASDWLPADLAQGYFADVALDPRPAADGRHLWALMNARRGDAYVGVLAEFRLDSAGLHFVRTATSIDANLADLALDSSGQVALSGTRGVVYRGPLEGPWVRLPSPEVDEAERVAGRVYWTQEPQSPLLYSTASRLHLLAASSDRWSSTNFGNIRLNPIHFWGMARWRDELWVAGWRGELVRRGPSGVWGSARFLLPPRFASCGDGDFGALQEQTRAWSDIASDGDDLLLIAQDCQAVIELRANSTCAALVGFDEGSPRYLAEGTGLWAVVAGDGQAVVASGLGEVYVSDRIP